MRREARRTALAGWARKSEHESRARALLFLAQSEPGIPVAVERFDADPWALAVQKGVLDLRTGTLRPHRREDLHAKVVPVVYDAAAGCPQWGAFLARILAGNPRLIAFVQKAAGYALTGDISEQALFFLWGIGANGKTTLLKTILGLMSDYALSTRAETFMVKGPEAIPNDVARLRGAPTSSFPGTTPRPAERPRRSSFNTDPFPLAHEGALA